MKIIADTGRQIGKTTELIKLAAKNGGVIIVASRELVTSAHNLALHLGIELTKHQVTTYHQLCFGFLAGKYVGQVIYLDDWDYQPVRTNKWIKYTDGCQVGAVVTNKTQAEIEACLPSH